MSVDADLATLREYAYIGAGVVMRRRREVKDANEGVEAELSRLREQRDEWKDTAEEIGGELRRSSELREAAEARCARLQQALTEAKRRNSEAQALIDNALWEQRALIREALAGLDTPADSQEFTPSRAPVDPPIVLPADSHSWNQPLAKLEDGKWVDPFVPADSQPEEPS